MEHKKESNLYKSNNVARVYDLALEASSQLKRLQTGEDLLLKTGFPFLDNHMGGLLPASVITLAGSSGTGKTYLMHRIMENIMSKDVNPQADEFVSLEFSFEMLMLNKVMRDINKNTKLSRKDILTKEFDEETVKIVREYYANLKDNRRYVCQKPLTVEEWYAEVVSFCEFYKEKKAVLVAIDHLVLFKGSEKQKNIERVTDYQNMLKLQFPNLYFFDLSQLNRDSSFSGVKDRSNDVVPNNTWLYASSLIEMVSDYIIIIANPFKSGIVEYMSFNPSRYEYLSEFFAGEDNKGRQSFTTVGNLFYFVTKVRDSDVPYENVYIEKMDISSEVLDKMQQSVLKTETPSVVDIPVFEFGGGNAFLKASWDKEDTPF